MRERLVIIGAAAMGREACTYAREAGMSVKGFLDSRTSLLDCFTGYPPILGSAEDYEIAADDVFVCAVGDPAMKQKYAELIAKKGGTFVSVIHPLAYIGQNVTLGAGCIIAPHATITNDTVLGDHVIVNVNASVSHDNRIGELVSISPGCHLAGRVTLGARVFVGVGASIIPDVTLGVDVFVAAGAVVTRAVKLGRIMGIPARSK